MACVLHGKYYPNGDFLHTFIPNFSSFLQRSVTSGREVCDDGHKWRINNGENVHVFKNPLLPYSNHFKVIFPCFLPLNTLVVELINDEMMWNESLINDKFLETNVKAILKISWLAIIMLKGSYKGDLRMIFLYQKCLLVC